MLSYAPTYDAKTLTSDLADYERHYGHSSEWMERAYVEDRLPRGISRQAALAWVITFRERNRLRARQT
jgi:hypothetical protein